MRLVRLSFGAFALAPLLASSPAIAFPGGAGLVGVSGNPNVNGGQDCSMSGCHTDFLNDPEFSRISGPPTVIAGSTVAYLLDIETSANRPTCGFNASATGGVLAANDTDTVNEVEPTSQRNEVHHSSPITDSANACGSIRFDWTAPQVATPVNATLYVGTVRASSDQDASNDFSANASFTIAVLPTQPAEEDLLAFGAATSNVTNLDNPSGIAVARDGENVYVTAEDTDALLSFQRDGDTGGLAFQTSRVDGAGSPAVDGLRQPIGVVASGSDFLYTASVNDSAVATFARGFAGVPNYDPDGTVFIQATARTHTDIALSPDEQVLYVTGDDASMNGLAVLDLDPATGWPGVLQGIRSGSGGVGSSEFPGSPQAVAVSPDSRFVYVGGANPSGIAVLERQPASLMLSTDVVQFVRDHEDGVHDLGAPDYLAMSAGGQYLYAVDFSGDSLVSFRRNPDGTLAFVQALVDGEVGADALNGPTHVVAAPNGFVFVPSELDDALGVYRPQPGGFLVPAQDIFDADAGVTGLLTPGPVALAAGGRDVYVGGELDGGSVTRFVPEPDATLGAAAALAAALCARRRRA